MRVNQDRMLDLHLVIDGGVRLRVRLRLRLRLTPSSRDRWGG